MVVKLLSNPHSFVREANAAGVHYAYLLELINGIGAQKTSLMFDGKSKRGGVSSLSSIMAKNWLCTFEYALAHPDVEDADRNTARAIVPRQAYFDYVELLKVPIPDDEVASWSTMSNSALGKLAPKYGVEIGTRNGEAIKTIHARMNAMVERRRANIWGSDLDSIVVDESTDYRSMNVSELRRLLKERHVANAHIKLKDGLIELLEANPTAVVEDDGEYSYMSKAALRALAKERNLKFTTKFTRAKFIDLLKD